MFLERKKREDGQTIQQQIQVIYALYKERKDHIWAPPNIPRHISGLVFSTLPLERPLTWGKGSDPKTISCHG